MKNQSYPAAVNGFNVYKDGSALIGLSDQVQLPTLDAITASISGGGLLGSMDVPVIGHFGNLQQVIPFRNLTEDMFSVMDPSEAVNLTLRGDIQGVDKQTGAVTHSGMRIVFRGLMSSFTPGSVQAANAMEASVTLNLSYLLIEVGGKTKLELDKFNYVYKVDGKDQLAEIKKNL